MGPFDRQRAIWDSQLPPHLKLVALAMLSFADADGRNIYPSVARVSGMVSKCERVVQRDIAALIDRGFLVMESAGGGRTKTARYRFEKGDAHVGVSNEKGDAHVTFPDDKPRRARHETVTCTAERVTSTTEKGDVYVTRSVHDQTIDQTREHTPAAPACADAPTDQDGPRFAVYVAVAKKALGDSLTRDRSDDLGNVVEHFKTRCATERPPLPYDGDIARRACDAAIFARNKARATLAANLRGAGITREAVAS